MLKIIKKKIKIKKINDLKFPYYLRILAKDKSGVMASITKVLSSYKVSIESIIQKPSQKKNYAEIILIIHSIKESTLTSALKKIKGKLRLGFALDEKGNQFIPINQFELINSDKIIKDKNLLAFENIELYKNDSFEFEIKFNWPWIPK